MSSHKIHHLQPHSGRLLILADLHWDFWDKAKREPLHLARHHLEDVDGILIAGDLTNKPKVRWKNALRDLKKYAPSDRIFVFPGNHDYYDFRIDDDERLEQIAEAEGVNFIQNGEIRAGQTRFLCTTLWTDLDLAPTVYHVDTFFNKMNDYRCIRVASQAFRRCLPKDTRAQHRQQLKFLVQALEQPFDGETVVVTHHAPIPEATKGNMACFYASNLKHVMKAFEPSAWYFGHTHTPVQLNVGPTHVQNVSLGYPSDLTDEQAVDRISKSIVEYNPLLARNLSLR